MLFVTNSYSNSIFSIVKSPLIPTKLRDLDFRIWNVAFEPPDLRLEILRSRRAALNIGSIKKLIFRAIEISIGSSGRGCFQKFTRVKSRLAAIKFSTQARRNIVTGVCRASIEGRGCRTRYKQEQVTSTRSPGTLH